MVYEVELGPYHIYLLTFSVHGEGILCVCILQTIPTITSSFCVPLKLLSCSLLIMYINLQTHYTPITMFCTCKPRRWRNSPGRNYFASCILNINQIFSNVMSESSVLSNLCILVILVTVGHGNFMSSKLPIL